MSTYLIALAASTAMLPTMAAAQNMPGMDMPGMHHPGPRPKSTKPKPPKYAPKPPTKQHPASHVAHGSEQRQPSPPIADNGAPATPTPAHTVITEPEPAVAPMSAMDHARMGHGGMYHSAMSDVAMPMGGSGHMMRGALGDTPMTRDGSGTSWVPDSAPMAGAMFSLGGQWTGMAHGSATLVYDHQGGARGADKTFVASMLMGMAQRPLGAGTLTVKGMVSLDPLMGNAGYPLLLATGETADGRTELVDRQHPHDALAELSLTISQPLGRGTSGFVYLAYPGEPAIGPTTYLHRYSGMGNPEAPISHHYFDSSHITFGVATAGVVHGPLKLEGSLFTGREPDQHRWDVERPRFDSWSVRATLNPTADWSLQASHAFLKSPEGLHPEENIRRTTASATYNRPLANGFWQTTVAYGRNRKAGGDHGPSTKQAGFLESAFEIGRWGAFARGEIASKDELFGDEAQGDPLAGRRFTVGKLSVGGYRSLPLGKFTVDLGGLVSAFALPDELKPRYGNSPKAVMLFTRLKLGRSLAPSRSLTP